MVKEPTHLRGTQRATLIDLILVKDENLIDNLEYLPPFGKSHHQVLDFYIMLKNCKSGVNKQTKFLVNKGDYNAMRKSFENKEWDTLLKEEDDVDKWWDIIYTDLEEAKHKFIPAKTFTKGTRRVKIVTDPTLLTKFKLKRERFKAYKINPTVLNYVNYCQARNIVKAGVRKAKKEKELNMAKLVKTNPKAFYQYIASQTKPKEKVSNLVKEDGSLTENDLEKTEVLNNFFQ